jgi:site-specific DNA-methyltransferase (adenine-specific)
MVTPVLLHGDCLELMKTLPDKSVDCFICDLPYGCLHPERKRDTEKWYDSQGQARGSPWDVKLNLEEFWVQVKRLCKNDHTPVLMFCNTRFGFELYNSNPSWFRYDLVWNKMRGISFLLANKQPLRCHEMIYVFSKKGAAYKRIDEDSELGAWEKPEGDNGRAGTVYGFDDGGKARSGASGKRCSLSVLQFKKRASYQLKGTHPTEKPLELYKWLLSRYCPDGGTVLDPTAGSFNAIIAARDLGLKGIGIEKDDAFFEKAYKKLIPPATTEPDEPDPDTITLVGPDE